jgi:hypothetical protein
MNMNILYITTSGTKTDYYSPEKKEYDLDQTRNTIKEGIIKTFPDVAVTFPRSIITNDGYIPEGKVGDMTST